MKHFPFFKTPSFSAAFLLPLLLVMLPACQQLEQAAQDLDNTDEPTTAEDIDATSEGEIGLIEPPRSVVPNTSLESNDRIYVFREQAGHEMQRALVVDATAPGTYRKSGDLEQTRLPAGTRVQSYFLHFDLVGTSSAKDKRGRITFKNPIAAVIVNSGRLDASDDAMGTGKVAYPDLGNGDRGLEMGPQDNFTISSDGHMLKIAFHTSTSSDQIRILTEAP